MFLRNRLKKSSIFRLKRVMEMVSPRLLILLEMIHKTIKSSIPVGPRFYSGFTSAVTICLEWWSYELTVLLSKILSNPQLETSVLSICYLSEAPTIAPTAYLRMTERPPVLPSNNFSYSENFLYKLHSLCIMTELYFICWGDKSYKPNPRLARVLDILFIFHAEHEMNCSTMAVRHLASSGIDVYTAPVGEVGALYGPIHGGVVLMMLNEIVTVENIPEFIEVVKKMKRKMLGFRHRVYKSYDPRAEIIKQLAEEVFSIVGRDPLIEMAIALEQAALSDTYFVKRKLYQNVDFYSDRAIGFLSFFSSVCNTSNGWLSVTLARIT